MQEIVVWLSALIGSGALVTAAKLWYDIGVKSRQIDQHETALGAMEKRHSDLAGQLAAHQLESERQFAKVDAVVALDHRLTDAIDGMRADFRDVSGRIDRLIELAAKGQR